MIDYSKFPGLAGVYLEDSYVLEIVETPQQIVFRLDAVLTPESPAYHPPRPGEHYCYAAANLVFPDVAVVEWIRRTEKHFTDATGEEDLGNIDILQDEGDGFIVEGDWGRLRIVGRQPILKLTS
ncbi:hypothetical protein BST22_13740 [Mycolicibacterium chubuense]|uniref:Uncharacterized protein n=1 Tax=Mycolicibacterium chubuense TaxID=1800 RepID=A0A0J6WNI8_MYCCU|nr:hypothetical protein [Mycolicibacterium chubuense]KMO84144.1 hypothetical protein MCHUDSM44219_00950 [Mycolicibacterium chubuense]ORA51907.1 hypothetical protein BST22_13740 [Mycolicibacterium chubuense]SPX99832.1 Uncharacterised protein [Mycolicibacterium chubuense]